MEFVRAGEALLRTSYPLLPFLAPTAYRNPPAAAIRRHCRPQRLRQPIIASFSTSCLRRQESAAAAWRQYEDDGDQSNKPPSRAPDEFDDLLNSALSRISPARGPQQQQRKETSSSYNHTRATADDSDPDNGSSFDDIMRDISVHSMRGRINPNDVFNPSPRPPPPPQPAPMKLGPSVGRTIRVVPEKGIDVGRAFRMLEQRCALNKVKSDFMRQRFHERPGLKRKRLKQERWRKRFKEAFQGTVSMVKRMKKQGW